MNKRNQWRIIGFAMVFVVFLGDQFSKWLIMTRLFGDMEAPTFSSFGTGCTIQLSSGAPRFIPWLFASGERLAHTPIKVTEFFSIVMVWNPGVSFGMLQNDAATMTYLLSGFAVLVAVGFLIWLWREPRLATAFPIGLIAGGALANVYDRLRYGAVADFFDVHIGAWHWPAFNIADAAITYGVFLLLIDQIFISKYSSQGGASNDTV